MEVASWAARRTPGCRRRSTGTTPWASLRLREEEPLIEGLQRAATAEQQGLEQLRPQELKDSRGAVLASRRQPPQHRPADAHGVRPERQGLEHVRPAADPP